MKFLADIEIMPHKELLDPQGKTVAKNIKNLNIAGVEDVRIGKKVSIVLDAESEEEAAQKVDEACRKLLANVIMETFQFTIKPHEG